MLRTLGFLSGVTLTMGALMLALEPADLLRIQAAATSALPQIAPQLEGASKTIPKRLQHLPAGEQRHMPADPPPAPIPVQEPLSAAEPQLADTKGAAADHPDPEPLPERPLGADAEKPVEATPSETSLTEAQRHLFWNPFRSERAAQGFAGRLSSATDVAVVVVQASPLNYRVGFDYRDEAERRALIERIQTVTGLELE